MKIQKINNTNTNYTFQAHLPRKFSNLMNYLSRNLPENFDNKDIIRVTTVLKDGTEVSGYAHFTNGHYSSLTLDSPYNMRKQEFMRTVLESYNLKVAKGRTLEKLKKLYNKKTS